MLLVYTSSHCMHKHNQCIHSAKSLTSVKGEAQTRCVYVATIDTSTHCVSALPSADVQKYSTVNAVMPSKYTMANFCTGLPHVKRYLLTYE